MDLTKFEQFLFSIGIYPKLNAIDKTTLLFEYLEEKYPNHEEFQSLLFNRKLKRLSVEKKASFALFYEQLNMREELARYKELGVKWTHLFAPDYPAELQEIYAPPVVLFYKGEISVLKNKTWLGIVGSREHSTYGVDVIQKIVPKLLIDSKNEIGIVSGLAKGIDTEAHMTTIKNAGNTVGVIGTGLDQYYPTKNRMLQQLMSEKQLVISEYPLGTKPLSYHFPERNRIIAGLSRGVLVIEAQKRSGSLITAYNAIDEGRDVFAVPGSIFEENRAGNHRLIQLGAILTESSDDILNEWLFI